MDNNSINNIDLAYSYTEEFLKDRKDEIKHLDWRLGLFLLVAGVTLCVGIDLPNRHPGYWLTKTGVLLSSAISLSMSAWGLRTNSRGRLVSPSYLMEDECFIKETPVVKAMIVNTHKKAVDELDSLAKLKQNYLNQAMIWLAASFLLFLINTIFVFF